MSWGEVACWAAVLLSVMKLGDAASLYLPMAFKSRIAGQGVLPEAFVFRTAARYPALAHVVDILWRSPFLLLVAVPATFVAVDNVEGWLLITTAALAVAVAINPVATLLVGATFPNKFNTEEVLALAGLHYHRAGNPEHPDRDAISAVPTIVGVALGYLVAFGALYFALSHGSRRAFIPATGELVVRLDWVEALLYSVTTGSTLGDDKITAISVGARSVVAVQLLATGAAVTLYTAFLLKSLVDRQSRTPKR